MPDISNLISNRRTICTTLVCLVILHNAFTNAHGHGHSHDHGHGHGHGHSHSHEADQPASFKYSKEANEPHHHHSHEYDSGDIKAQHSEKVVWKATDPNNEPRPHSKFRAAKVPKLNFTLAAQAFAATLFISLVPFIVLFFVPVDNTDEYEPFLKVLLSFASGGLLGDAFLHLIPHAIIAAESRGGHSHHGHSHSEKGEGHGHAHDLSVGLWVLVGLGVFLMVEKMLRFIKSDEGHGHSHGAPLKKGQEGKMKVDSVGGGDSPRKKMKSEHEDVGQVAEQDMKISGYLNLAADFIHNFTDGLAIGASFLAGHGIGLITTITVVFHEIPHEIGDFAILIQSGCTRTKAMRLQLTTAIGALTGTLCSLLAEGVGESATAWILPFTAGGFIYIATVSIIPELISESSLYQSVKEMMALIIGVSMMVVIAMYE